MQITAVLITAVSFLSSAKEVVNFFSKSQVPEPASMSVEVETSGRTSTLKYVEVAQITGEVIPETFSDTLVHNTPGFTWYVSRHFAIKTNLDKTSASESLALLETAWPQYKAIFGRTPPGMEFRRLAIVLASDRNSLERAMIDDDMHVLNLGGITQEGYACAYLYTGISYQTRYILLHEATHLFQYCISGNTRNCYGFFVEGIADFFSSHVYDRKTRTLTVNVLDRAPIHNHLAAGIEEWQRLGKPSFTDLYEHHRGSRGLDVIQTAFMQSTPDFERNWLEYCASIVENTDPSKAKAISDKLLHTLYGEPSKIDAAFAGWMDNLTPSFLTGIREFDQDGDSFISVYTPSDSNPATLTLTNPEMTTSDFVLDWPHSQQPETSATQAFFTVGITLPEAKEKPAVAGLRFYSRELRMLKETAVTNSSPDQVSVQLSFSEAELSDPPAPASACIAEMFASVPGITFTPKSYSMPGKNHEKAAGCRFTSTDSLSRLVSASQILGKKAPIQLLIAIKALKSQSDTALVIPEDTATVEFWHGIADSIAKSGADSTAINNAICKLSGIKIAVSKIKGDRILVEMQNSFPAPGKTGATLATGTQTLSPVGKTPMSFIFKAPHEGAVATVNTKWLGHSLTFHADYDGGREITDWHVLGPFRMADGKFENETLPPDTYPFDLEKVFLTDDGSRLFWKKAKTCGGNQTTPALLHFAKEFGRQANFSTAYAYTTIECEKEENCELILGVTDGITVWNNSAMIYSSIMKREWSDGNVRIPLSLKKGTNKLLFKLLHSNGVWFLSARTKPLKQ